MEISIDLILVYTNKKFHVYFLQSIVYGKINEVQELIIFKKLIGGFYNLTNLKDK